MAIRTVTYISSCPVSCYLKVPASVILCVPSAKVALADCAGSEMFPPVNPQQSTPFSFIEATLSSINKEGSCGNCLYKQTFTYEDTQLLPGEVIYATDISGVICRDCLTEYIDQKVGNGIYLTADSEEEDSNAPVKLVNQYGCETVLPFQRVYSPPNTIPTTDATPFPIPFLVPGLVHITFSIQIDIIAVRTGGIAGTPGDAGIWKVIVGAKYFGGIVSFIGTPVFVVAEKDQPALDVTFGVIANVGYVNFVGTLNNDFSWKLSLRGFDLELP